MKRQLVLIAHEDANVQAQLQAVLEVQGAQARYARTCAEVRAALGSRRVPDIIFAGIDFPDGSWEDVLAMARAARRPVEVILTMAGVGPYLDVDDTKIYLDAMNRGAFDFVVPPFAAKDVAIVVRSATQARASAIASWATAS